VVTGQAAICRIALTAAAGALGAMLASTPLAGQRPLPVEASGTGVITGRAIDGVTKAPVPGAARCERPAMPDSSEVARCYGRDGRSPG
jgi:hypothetical protein